MGSEDERGGADAPSTLDIPVWDRLTAREPPNRPALEQPARDPSTSPFDPKRERFELGAELGRGGMGRVVAVMDTALSREVAVKQALADDAVLLERFEREVRITALLEHASIVPIY